jgi:hydroxypyruvate reductase
MDTNDQLKQAALKIFEAGLQAVDPYRAVRRVMALQGASLVLTPPGGEPQTFDLDRFDRIVVVGGGKASARMVQALEDLLGERISGGLVNVKTDHLAPVDRVELVEAGHPIPDDAGLAGARRIAALLQGLDERALVIGVISGGGSALLPLPAEGITLADKQAITGQLLAAGAEIGEINAVRKHISALKGGQLARCAAPATLINLLLSDVVGDRLDVIASGPTVADSSTFAEAREILERYELWAGCPAGIRRRIERGTRGEVAETPKPGDPALSRCSNVVIGGNRLALRACERAAREAGFNTVVLSSTIEGETREIARMHGAIGREIREAGAPLAPPACVISGGETTVTLRGGGKGGRNQEFALAAALEIAGLRGLAVFSGGTDGTDGPTDAAGAIAFGDTVARGTAAGLGAAAHLRANDAYPFFDRLGDLVRSGPTGTNVMDLHLVLVTT